MGKIRGKNGVDGTAPATRPPPAAWNRPTKRGAAHIQIEQERPGERTEGKPPTSFEARFGRIIAQNGVAAVPAALYLYQGKLDLTAQEVWFISYILAHKWDGALPHPRLNEMARQTGAVKQILHRYKNRLCEAGCLTIHQRYKENGGQDANDYDFSGLFAQLENLILQDPPTENDIRLEDDESEDGGYTDATRNGTASALNRSVRDEEPLPNDTSFLARYGRVIISKGVAAVPMALFTCQRQLGLTPQQVWFVSYIFSFKWTAALPHPSINKMAQRTGYSKVQLHEIKSSLVDASYLTIVHRYRRSGGQTNNAYDFSGLFEAIRQTLQEKSGGSKRQDADDAEDDPTSNALQPEAQPALTLPVRTRRGQAAARARAGKQSTVTDNTGNSKLTGYGNSELMPSGNSEIVPPGNSRITTPSHQQFTPPSNRRLTEPGNEELPTTVKARLLPSVTEGVHEIETIKVEPLKRADSNQFSPYISAVITDFSNELGDPEHSISNVTQTLHIWRRSGLDEQAFTELMHEARKRTRSYQGKQGLGTIDNRMAYFFRVLRQLL